MNRITHAFAIPLLIATTLLVTTGCQQNPRLPDATDVSDQLECSLAPAEWEERLGEIHTLFGEHCLATKELPEGYAFHFDGGENSFQQVTEIARKESQCCPFLSWNIGKPEGGRFWVHVTGSEEAKSFVHENLVLHLNSGASND